jgi:hypothetical protein
MSCVVSIHAVSWRHLNADADTSSHSSRDAARSLPLTKFRRKLSAACHSRAAASARLNSRILLLFGCLVTCSSSSCTAHPFPNRLPEHHQRAALAARLDLRATGVWVNSRSDGRVNLHKCKSEEGGKRASVAAMDNAGNSTSYRTSSFSSTATACTQPKPPAWAALRPTTTAAAAAAPAAAATVAAKAAGMSATAVCCQ